MAAVSGSRGSHFLPAPLIKTSQAMEVFDRVQKVALPIMATLAGIYFGYEYCFSRAVVHLVLSTTLGLGGAQEIFLILSTEESTEKSRSYRSLAVALGVFSFLATGIYFFSFITTFQIVKLAAFSTHFFLTCRSQKVIPDSLRAKKHKLSLDQTTKFTSFSPKKVGSYSTKSRPPSGGFFGFLGLGGFYMSLPKKETHIPSSPQGLRNVDGASCFFNATLKALLNSPSIRDLLDVEITTSTIDFTKESREHIRQRLRILRDQLGQDSPNPQIVSQAWYELRYENEDILRRFPAYQQDCARELYTLFEQVLGIDSKEACSLDMTYMIQVGVKPVRETLAREPTTMLQLNTVQEDVEVVEFSLPKALIKKLGTTKLDKKAEESDDNFTKRKDLLSQLRQGKLNLKFLNSEGYLKPESEGATFVQQLNSLLNLGDDDTVVQETRNEKRQKPRVRIQELLDATFAEETVKDRFEDGGETYTEFKRTPKLSHSDVRNFNEFSLLLPRFKRGENGKNHFNLVNLEEEITITVFDRATGINKEIRMRLKSIVCHYGSTRNSGHYFTYVKKGDDWVLHDDSSVSTVTGEIQNQVSPVKPQRDPLLLFYEKVQEVAEEAEEDE